MKKRGLHIYSLAAAFAFGMFGQASFAEGDEACSDKCFAKLEDCYEKISVRGNICHEGEATPDRDEKCTKEFKKGRTKCFAKAEACAADCDANSH